jgi:uncharacterized repeat protein (TIGR01451 family)
MKKTILILSAFFLFYCNALAQPYFNWAGTFGIYQATQGITTTAVETDHEGNCILTGFFGGTVDFAFDTTVYQLSSDSVNDAFIAKYDASGALLWVNQFKCDNQNFISHIKCDANNNIIIFGIVKDTVDVDPSSSVYNLNPGNASGNFYLMKFDNNGSLLWARSTGSSTNDLVFSSFDISETDELYISGYFYNTVDFDFGAGIDIDSSFNSTSTDGFILKLDANGNYVWHKCIKGPGSSDISGIKVKNNKIYISGGFTMFVDFDPGAGVNGLTSSFQSDDGFVLIWDDNGNFVNVWKTGEDTGFDLTSSIAVDENGYIYISGVWDGNISFNSGNYSYNATGTEDYYLLKMDEAGNLFWFDKTGTFVTGSNNVIITKLTYDPVNGVLLSGHFSIDYDFDPSSAGIHLIVHNSADAFILNLDVNGNFKYVNIYSGPGNENITDMATTAEGVIYATGYFRYDVDFDPGPGQYILTGTPVNTVNCFLTALNQQTNFATGMVYRDMNLDAVFNTGDFPIANTLVHLSNGRNSITRNNGSYLALFDTGTVNLSYQNLPPYANALPLIHTISNSSYNNISAGNDFAIQVPLGTTDGAVILTNINRTRTGRPSYLELKYTNKGSTPISGYIKFVKDQWFDNPVASAPPALLSGDTMWWNFSNLLPLETRTILINGTISFNATTGSMLHSFAEINSTVGDVLPADNIDTLNQPVTGSFDPNSKQVIPEAGFTSQQVADGEYLEYIIRFQNTGNDTAFVIQLIDTLSSFLDVSTFEVMASSHDYNVQLIGNNILQFVFDNILLPDSNVNEALSHGYIRYRIKPLSITVQGQLIENTAYIYFDLNAPVVTNTTTTLITAPVSVYENAVPSIIIYPVPVNSGESIKIKGNFRSCSVIELFDFNGRKLLTGKLSDSAELQSFPIPQLAEGFYQCRIMNENEIYNFKLQIINQN